MGNCDSDDDFRPSKKRKVQSAEHFAKPNTTNELELLSKGVVPKNTHKNDAWAFKTFLDWVNS